MDIAIKPFHSISVHGSRANTLALHHTVELNDGNMAQQQLLDAKPSFIGKQDVCSGLSTVLVHFADVLGVYTVPHPTAMPW